MKRLASWTLAVAGAVAGAGLVTLLARNEAAHTGLAPAGSVASDARFQIELTRRLDAIERSMRLLEARSSAPGTPRVALAEAASDASAAPSLDTGQTALHGPAFEAAVLDVIERVEQRRDGEQRRERDDTPPVGAASWANELTMRLGLSPAQSERLLQIQAELAADLRQSRARVPEAQSLARDRRRAVSRALRQRAEQELHDVLDARQLAAYHKLDHELKGHLLLE